MDRQASGHREETSVSDCKVSMEFGVDSLIAIKNEAWASFFSLGVVRVELCEVGSVIYKYLPID